MESEPLKRCNWLKSRNQYEDIDYINPHATSTPMGDLVELNGINKLFKGSKNLDISATKSMTGHLLGAAGAAKPFFPLKLLKTELFHQQLIFIRLMKIFLKISILFLEKLKKKYQLCISNAFGFGGHNATLIFKSFLNFILRNNFMSKLKEIRELQNLTQEELAESSGISVRTIQRIEAGTTPKGYTLRTLSKTLGVSEEVLQNTPIIETEKENIPVQENKEETTISYSLLKIINLSSIPLYYFLH
jgi:transcriptional regulator with XRE-family HTH domain